MRYLLWAEGTSDAGLCEVLNWLLAKNHVDVTEAVSVTKADYPTLEKLLNREWAHLLFLHWDADSDQEIAGKGPRTRRQKLKEWIHEATVALPPTICVIPVQEIEAWLLTQTDLPLAHIEAQTSPKEKLKAILEQKQRSTMTKEKFSEQRQQLWAQLVQNTEALRRLESLPAFQQLVTDTTEAIRRHGLTQH